MIKKCIINVAIGDGYRIEQIRLGKTLKEHEFDGDFLTWTDFANDNYNKENRYNCKAAAFEEALKQGYTQLLWLDCPAIAIKNIQPIFDKIHSDGYYTIQNHDYNCAQTCSDKCLEYYNISRDTAETFQEHASGVIGINYDNPKGKKLLDMFIKGCKDGAADGSRVHDNQSSDKRFLFHRQDQSVLSITANIIGLPPNEFWNSGLVAYHKISVIPKTIIVWRRGW